MIVLFVIVILPLILISSLVIRELVTFYQELDSGNLFSVDHDSINRVIHSSILPGFEIDLNKQLIASAEWFTGNIGEIFAGTISTIFIFFISMIGFYF